MITQPILKIIGEDGNAFAILGKAQRVARQAGWPQDKIDQVLNEAKAGDYDHLLQTMMENFDVR